MNCDMSINPKPSYHLCPDFSIAAPPNGPLDLGSVLPSLDVDGLLPLNEDLRIPVPADRILPRGGPDVKRGFSSTMSRLRSAEAGIWAKIFGMDNLGGELGWLHKRNEDKTLTIKELRTTYFNPTNEYMAQTLALRNVDAFVQATRKKAPLYMITGIKVAVGAMLSETKGKTDEVTAKGGAVEPNSMTDVGGKIGFTNEDKAAVGFEDSTDFVLGYRLRKIYWKNGVMKTSDKVAGSTLEEGRAQPTASVLADVEVVDDFTTEDELTATGRVFVHEEGLGGIEPSVWVLP